MAYENAQKNDKKMAKKLHLFTYYSRVKYDMYFYAC